MSQTDNYDDLDFDPVALRQKYKEEREKRLREDGSTQYIEVKGEYAKYVNDPYMETIERDPVSDEVDVLIIGGGFSGLVTGARLREAGVENIRIVESAGDFGGTWYWTRYPGAQCDIESYIYMPLLEELNYIPKEKYSYAPEIREHCFNIGRHYRLYENTLFHTEVNEMRWDESAARWVVSTDRGDSIRARFVTLANGSLNQPKLPGVPGITDFKGHAFHTSRWDYDYTGGSSTGGLTGLKDKRVAIIGTGATAVQVVPHVGEAAQQLYVFQRTPSGVDVRGNAPTDPEWVASLKPGWQKERMDNFNAMVSGVPQEVNLVDDGWTDLIGNMLDLQKNGEKDDKYNRSLPEIMELANFAKMNEIRARVDELVADPDTAEALKPYYQMFCKRPCFHDDYLPTFNRPTVSLIDTNGQGVDHITETGLVVNGVEYEVDCIIFSTGFEVGTEFARRKGYPIIGKGGQTLNDKWAEGMRTMHGIHINGFPNCFLISPNQAGFSANNPHAFAAAAGHVAYVIEHALKHDVSSVEVTAAAEDAWVDEIVGKTGAGMQIGGDGCTPGYYNNEGQPNPLSRFSAFYPHGAIKFWELIAKWREDGNLEGLELK
jgi:cation diffusion facilitator CzcD-associated flavoprotein CzcO